MQSLPVTRSFVVLFPGVSYVQCSSIGSDLPFRWAMVSSCVMITLNGGSTFGIARRWVHEFA
jgi:hypothetical protein